MRRKVYVEHPHAGRRFAVFIALWAIAGASYAADTVAVSPGASHWNLAPHADYLNENEVVLSVEDVSTSTWSEKFRPVSDETINLGLRRGASWFRFNVANPREHRATFYVELDNARIKQAEFHAPNLEDQEAHQVSGTALPFGERSRPYRNPVFRLTLEPGQEVPVYLRVYHRGSYRFNLLLWEYNAFIKHDTLRGGLYGMFYGSLLIMFVFNLVLAGLFRDRSFLLLSIIIAGFGLYMMAYQRLDAQFLWPDATHISGSRVNVIFGLVLCASFFLSRDYLGTAGNAPRLDKVFRIYGVLSLFLCLDVFIDGIWSDWLLQALGGMAPIFLMSGAIYRVRQGNRNAWGYIVTWGIMFSTMTAFALMGAGFLPQTFLIEHGPKIAFPIALSLNSVGLWQRFRELQDKHAANLEVQVEERTRELSEALANVKALHGLIPICSSCKNIRNDEGFWIRVETYIRDRSDADFTHGICPECMEQLYGRKSKT